MQLAFSHDGFQWFRQPERTSAIARSNAADLFPTYVMTTAPLELGDELWVYYSEANGSHPRWPKKDGVSQIRAATWRKDGFVSMECADKGTLITPPLVFEGKNVRVNCSTQQSGSVRVALLDETGKPLKGHGLKDCQPLTGDSVSGKVGWKKQNDLSALQDKPVRLRFEIEKAQLWSFRFAP